MKSNGVEATRNLIKILLIVVAQTGKFFEPKSCDKYGEEGPKVCSFRSPKGEKQSREVNQTLWLKSWRRDKIESKASLFTLELRPSEKIKQTWARQVSERRKRGSRKAIRFQWIGMDGWNANCIILVSIGVT